MKNAYWSRKPSLRKWNSRRDLILRKIQMRISGESACQAKEIESPKALRQEQAWLIWRITTTKLKLLWLEEREGGNDGRLCQRSSEEPVYMTSKGMVYTKHGDSINVLQAGKWYNTIYICERESWLGRKNGSGLVGGKVQAWIFMRPLKTFQQEDGCRWTRVIPVEVET